MNTLLNYNDLKLLLGISEDTAKLYVYCALHGISKRKGYLKSLISTSDFAKPSQFYFLTSFHLSDKNRVEEALYYLNTSNDLYGIMKEVINDDKCLYTRTLCGKYKGLKRMLTPERHGYAIHILTEAFLEKIKSGSPIPDKYRKYVPQDIVNNQKSLWEEETNYSI